MGGSFSQGQAVSERTECTRTREEYVMRRASLPTVLIWSTLSGLGAECPALCVLKQENSRVKPTLEGDPFRTVGERPPVVTIFAWQPDCIWNELPSRNGGQSCDRFPVCFEEG